MNREDLIKSMEALVAKAESESRGLTDEEKTEFSALETKLADLKDLEARKLQTKNEQKILNTVNNEERHLEISTPKVDEKQLEARVWLKSLSGEKLTELETGFNNHQKRSLDITNDSFSTIPTLIMDKINEKMLMISPILNYAVKTNANAPFSMFAETTNNAGAVRSSDVNDASGSVTDLVAAAISFTPKYLYNEVLFSKALMSQSGVGLEQFVVNALARGMAKLLDDQIISGSGGSGQIRGLDALSTIAGVSVLSNTQATTAVMTRAELRALYNKMPMVVRDEGHRNNSLVFIMHPDTIDYLVSNLTIQDAIVAGTPSNFAYAQDKRSELQGLITERPARLLFGCPVIPSDALATLTGDNIPAALFLDASKLVFNTFAPMGIEEVRDSTLLRQGQRLIGLHHTVDANFIDQRGLVQFICANI